MEGIFLLLFDIIILLYLFNNLLENYDFTHPFSLILQNIKMNIIEIIIKK